MKFVKRRTHSSVPSRAKSSISSVPTLMPALDPDTDSEGTSSALAICERNNASWREIQSALKRRYASGLDFLGGLLGFSSRFAVKVFAAAAFSLVCACTYVPRQSTSKNAHSHYNHLKDSSMDKFVVRGGEPLLGTVRVSGAKNAALPCMA